MGGNVNANGIRQHYIRYGGHGPALVLIPGITSPAITWGFVGERLGRHFDTYILDVRGRGLSETGPDLAYTLDAYVADAASFIEALGLKAVNLVGHSMGARIALCVATRTSAPLDRVVLIDPPVSGPGRRTYPGAIGWYMDSIRAATDGMTAEDMLTFCPTWSEEQLSLRAEWLHTCYPPAVMTTYEGFHEDDIHADFPRLAVPALLMVAGKGGVIHPADEIEIKGLCPSIQITHVADAGHMIPFDDFEGFFQAFGDFLGTRLA